MTYYANIFLNVFDFSLPLKSPVLIFSLILFIILFAPIILNRFKIPHLIGLIIAGALIGPNGFNLMLRDSSIVLFGTVGLFYIMFLAGLEIDLVEFRKNSWKSLLFGLYTFIIPMTLGITVSYYVLALPMLSSILLASLFASHTLIAYPLISRLGVAKDPSVNITVGGTMITDTLALLVLAVVVGMTQGEITDEFWWKLGISIVLFVLVVIIFFPMLCRWFFKRYDDRISQYIFVLGLVYLGAFLAEIAGIEGIIGAFLTGLAINPLVPKTSALMNRIEFVGNALFIPIFLIGVGMLIDYRAFISDVYTIIVGITMTIVATSAKWIAAWLTQKSFRFGADQRRVIFGLSNAQAAATLAAVLVGYKIIIGETEQGEPIRLLNDAVLNGSILMILTTCTIASFSALKGAQNLAKADTEGIDKADQDNDERILIPVNSAELVEELVNLSVTIKSKNNHNGLFALNVIDSEKQDEARDKRAHKIMEKAMETAAATDNKLTDLIRYDLNVVNGILGIVKENRISDIILGWHTRKGITDTYYGMLTEGILNKCNTTTLIYRSAQPLATVKRYLVVVPPKAELEIGFPFWIIKVWNIARNTGAKIVFYAQAECIELLKSIQKKHPISAEYIPFGDWDEFLIVVKNLRSDDTICAIMSRRSGPSYVPEMAKIPTYLNKYFSKNNFLIIYPIQYTNDNDQFGYMKNPSVSELISDNLNRLDDLGKTLMKLFRLRN